VLAVSGNAVQIPVYYSDNKSVWQPAPCMPIQVKSTTIENCIPGDIIQMYWNVRTARATATTPATYEITQHTAFFLNGNITSGGVKGFTMLDCNFVPGPTPTTKYNYISTHFVAYSDFYAFTTPTAKYNFGYSVYHIQ
jgi:hypothetical protein